MKKKTADAQKPMTGAWIGRAPGWPISPRLPVRRNPSNMADGLCPNDFRKGVEVKANSSHVSLSIQASVRRKWQPSKEPRLMTPSQSFFPHFERLTISRLKPSFFFFPRTAMHTNAGVIGEWIANRNRSKSGKDSEFHTKMLPTAY